MEYIIVGGIVFLALFILYKNVKSQIKGENCGCSSGCSGCTSKCSSNPNSNLKIIKKDEK